MKKNSIVLLLSLFVIIRILAAPCGDVNSSGAIDIVDALMTAQYSVGLNPSGFDLGAAEVSGDGTITIVDALQIAQYSVGLITSFNGCSTSTPTPTSTVAPVAVFAVNCGGSAYTASDGTQYAADSSFSGGTAYTNEVSVSGTTDTTLYSTERYGDSTYSATVANGEYRVTLHFAENYHTAAGARIFDVMLEGTKALSSLDIYTQAGAKIAYVTTHQVKVLDGALTIQFVTVTENALINAIKVVQLSVTNETATPTPVPTPTPLRTATPTPGPTQASSGQKPRTIITSDLGADPDDEQSWVHLLVSANEFDLEGLIVSTSCWRKSQSSTSMLDAKINTYEQVYNNLKVHGDFPTPAYLRSISGLGQTGYSMGSVGSGKDSFGSNAIIAAVDKNDPRPVWVQSWGGSNTVAQALWKVQNTRSAAELATFVSKLRVYDILGQDEAGAWITKTFPNLIYIRFIGVYSWQYSDSWIDTNVQNHGALGSVYPDRKYATEGDSPAFFYMYPNGLTNPDKVDWGSWGGRCSLTKKANLRGMSAVTGESSYDTYYMYSDAAEGGSSIGKWTSAISNDFAARMDWSINSNYGSVNHHPVAVVNGDTSRQVLEVTASPGASVALSAAGSSDPDGNSLSYAWSYYAEPSSYGSSVSISNSSSSSASVTVPSNAGGKSIHIILTLSDNGSPSLVAYRRVVINVQ